MDKEFNELETAILEWMTSNYNDANLTAQISAAQFVNREYSGAGFFINITIAENLAPVDVVALSGDPRMARVISGPEIESKDIDILGGSLLFFKRGYIDMMELHGFGGDFFNETIRNFKLIVHQNTK